MRTTPETLPASDDGRHLVPLGLATALAAVAVVTGRAEVLVLMAAAPILWAVIQKPDVAVVVVVAILFTNAAVIAVKFHGAPPALGMLAPAPLVLALYIHLVRQERSVIVTRTLPWITLFLAFQMLSFVLARNPKLAWSTMNVSILEGLFLYLLVTNVVRGRNLVHVLVWTLAACGAFMGGLSLIQWVTGNYQQNFGGFAQIAEGLGLGLETARGKIHTPRLCGPIGEQNRYAQVMAMLIPLLYCYALAEARPKVRNMLYVALALTSAGCLLTYSRGAMVSLGMVGVLMVGHRCVPSKHLGLVGLACVMLFMVSPNLQSRVLTIPRALGILGQYGGESEEPDGAVKGRATAMLAATRVFIDNPLLGVGPGQFNQYSRAYSRLGGFRAFEGNREAHCLYLELAAENGVLGLGTFLVFIGVSITQLRRARHRLLQNDPAAALRISGFMFAVLAYAATALFLHFSYARYFWLILALSDSASRLALLDGASNGASNVADTEVA
jgi:putative inorganic carbon (HCO3(-)) transporter